MQREEKCNQTNQIKIPDTKNQHIVRSVKEQSTEDMCRTLELCSAMCWVKS